MAREVMPNHFKSKKDTCTKCNVFFSSIQNIKKYLRLREQILTQYLIALIKNSFMILLKSFFYQYSKKSFGRFFLIQLVKASFISCYYPLHIPIRQLSYKLLVHPIQKNIFCEIFYLWHIRRLLISLLIQLYYILAHIFSTVKVFAVQ